LAERRGFGAPSVAVYSTASVLHTRLRRCVASSFVIGFSSRTDRSRDRIPDRDARVFRPRSRDTDSSRSTDTGSAVSGGRELPAPIGWGSGRERQSLGRVLSCRGLARQSPDCRAWARSPGSRTFRAGLALERPRPHAPSTDPTFGSTEGQTGLPDAAGEGHAAVFRPWHARAPLPRGR
jgi:hypothetical protein